MAEKIVFENRYYKIEKVYKRTGSGITAKVSTGKGERYILKTICSDMCEYSNFGDKLERIKRGYNLLSNIIEVPKIIKFNYEEKAILREYIEGTVLSEINISEFGDFGINEKIMEINEFLEKKGYSIEFNPDKYIFLGDKLFYIGYEFEKIN